MGFIHRRWFSSRGDRIFENAPEHHNGILALMSSNGGRVSWYDKMSDEPSSIDCGILDVDGNGVPDCLVIDEYGQMGCINPVSGQWMWHISLYQDGSGNANIVDSKKGARKAVDLLDFPLVLPDLDDDSVRDLLLVTSLEQVHHNNFLFISGAHGRPIGKAYKLKSCEFIHKLQLDEGGINLFFNCINNDTELTKILSLPELFKLATNRDVPEHQLKSKSPIEQHRFYGQRRSIQSQRNIYSNGVVDLVVENSGKCPFNCTMSVSFSDATANGTQPTTIIQGTHMYGMVPAVLPKRKRGTALNSGFVIKFWEWLEDEGDTKKINASQSNNVTTASDPGVMRRIKEHVVLILFNGTSQKVINTSQSDIVQFCDGISSLCQPDINFQENSVAVVDLFGNKNNPGLITFYSTFQMEEGKEGSPNKWKLTTNVQQLRLELVSLYDT